MHIHLKLSSLTYSLWPNNCGFKVGTASCFNNSFLLNPALNWWRFWKLSSVKCPAQRAKLQL